MQLYAHRGLHQTFPENSLDSIRASAEQGISAVEIDIRRCSSGEIILFHDRNLKRQTGLNKYVIRTPYKQISDLMLTGGKGSPPIPLLKEVFETFGNSLRYILDIKKETWIEDGLEKQLLKMVDDFKLWDQVVFSSFNYFTVKRIARMSSVAKVGLILAHPWQMNVMNMSCFSSLHVDYRRLSLLNFSILQKQRKEIFVWTLNDSRVCEQLIAQYPISSIISDNPLALRQVVDAANNAEKDDKGNNLQTPS